MLIARDQGDDVVIPAVHTVSSRVHDALITRNHALITRDQGDDVVIPAVHTALMRWRPTERTLKFFERIVRECEGAVGTPREQV